MISPEALHLMSTSRFETTRPVEATVSRIGPRSTLAVSTLGVAAVAAGT